MNKILDDLESLSPDEMASVARLIEKFASRKKDSETEIIVDQPQGRKKPRKRVLLNENDTVESPRKGRGRTKPRKPSARPRRKGAGGRRDRGVMAQTQKVELSGQNKFLKMSERTAHKKDTKIDKQLWKDREVSTRPDEYQDVEVECKECKLWYDVNPVLVLIDPDTHDTNYTCDRCVRK